MSLRATSRSQEEVPPVGGGGEPPSGSPPGAPPPSGTPPSGPSSSGSGGPIDPKYISILWAGPERAAEIAGLHAGLFDPAWDEAAVTQLLEQPAAVAFLAHLSLEKATVGFIIGQIAGDDAEIISIGVAARLARQGIGRRLVEGFMRTAQNNGARRIFLEVAADNEAGVALYRGLGFAEVARRRAYYERPGAKPVDAVVMTKALPFAA
jgi:[ribosomal protein S18]-alanine N-acetyltransferase